ncbi:hypothetical protein [uncultured Brevundimonas sp.]|uniref:hypothetical protein n=1 Tax=uncultured Brevundimonas sp. TaxID=213418 RepID=UPI00260906B6|nr:hypothetical protein [uncultured Brevundimonas sp.]
MAAAAPDKPERGASAESRLTPSGPGRATVSRTKGDLPPSILDRYLIEHDGRGRAERFFRDHRADQPAFRDAGRALTAASAYPDVAPTCSGSPAIAAGPRSASRAIRPSAERPGSRPRPWISP